MASTTSLKLNDELKQKINRIALVEGKTAHALMVETLERGIEQALLQQQFYADGESALQETVQTNKAYRVDDVKAYVMARISGEPLKKPKPVPFVRINAVVK